MLVCIKTHSLDDPMICHLPCVGAGVLGGGMHSSSCAM